MGLLSATPGPLSLVELNPVIRHGYVITSMWSVWCNYSSMPWLQRRFNKPPLKLGHGWCIISVHKIMGDYSYMPLFQGPLFPPPIFTQLKQPTHSDSLLQWRNHECDGVSNHQPHDCLLNHLFRRRSQKTSKLRATGLCAGNSPVTGEFPCTKGQLRGKCFRLMTPSWTGPILCDITYSSVLTEIDTPYLVRSLDELTLPCIRIRNVWRIFLYYKMLCVRLII